MHRPCRPGGWGEPGGPAHVRVPRGETLSFLPEAESRPGRTMSLRGCTANQSVMDGPQRGRRSRSCRRSRRSSPATSSSRRSWPSRRRAGSGRGPSSSRDFSSRASWWRSSCCSLPGRQSSRPLKVPLLPLYCPFRPFQHVTGSAAGRAPRLNQARCLWGWTGLPMHAGAMRRRHDILLSTRRISPLMDSAAALGKKIERLPPEVRDRLGELVDECWPAFRRESRAPGSARGWGGQADSRRRGTRSPRSNCSTGRRNGGSDLPARYECLSRTASRAGAGGRCAFPFCDARARVVRHL